MILLRWYVECDEHGRKTEPELQYWNGTGWKAVMYEEVKVKSDEDRSDDYENDFGYV